MPQSNVAGRLRLEHRLKVDKIDAATGQHVGTTEKISYLEMPDALAVFNAMRAATGLAPLTEGEALAMIQQQQQEET